MMAMRPKRGLCACGSLAGMAFTLVAAPAVAQTSVPEQALEEAAALDGQKSGDIVVTATKSASGTSVQRAPLSVSAFGQEQLETAHVQSLSNVTFNVPNVNLNSANSFPGFSNFTIRGMSVYSTIPSSTPTVGVFVDGVYLGTPAAVGFNTFDLEGVEVLRGPQGLFFGRNVTAGAVLARTTDPKNTLGGNVQASVESGPNFTVSGVVTGPISDTLSVKVAGYLNDDDGYFKNIATGGKNGASRTVIGRAAVKFKPNADFTTVLKYEHGDISGDGAVNQDHVRLGRGRHDFRTRQGTKGFIDAAWNQLTVESNLQVGFGDGTITNILGLRNVDQQGLIDNDSTPILGWDQYNSVKHRQISDELRYSGTFGRVDVTAGIFGYADELKYIEDRLLFKGTTQLVGGGNLTTETFAEFVNLDIHLTDKFTVNLGERWSIEHKRADIQPLVAVGGSPCSKAARECATFKYPGNSKSWTAFTPRIGFQWAPTSAINVYGFWTKGFRSGGYNLRVANPNQVPTPYDQEVENTFELGVKAKWFDNRLTTNISVFTNDYKNLQRDIQIFGTPVGTVQTTSNPADVRIRGIEFEGSLILLDGFTISGNFGYLDTRFKDIRIDLSGNGTIGPEDYALKLPYLSPWSFGIAGTYEFQTELGDFSARLAYAYKDPSASNDVNNRFLPQIDNLDADISFSPNDQLTFSIYGKNLLNYASYTFDNAFTLSNPGLGADNLLAAIASPINKGRVLGAQVRFKF